jgi:hypothetical protein
LALALASAADDPHLNTASSTGFQLPIYQITHLLNSFSPIKFPPLIYPISPRYEGGG